MPASVVSGRSAFAEHAAQLIAGAYLDVCAFTQTLAADLYGGEAFAQTVKQFALQHERARVRILIAHPDVTARSANFLVELARRLPSRISLRTPGEPHLGIPSEYWIADERSVLFKERDDQLDAVWQPDMPLDARRQRRRFEEIWDHALPARELSELRI